MGTQGVAKTPMGQSDGLIVCPEGDEYPLADEPLSKSVLENINNQIASLKIFALLFHNIAVIGLQHKDAAKKVNGKAQKVEGVVQFFLK